MRRNEPHDVDQSIGAECDDLFLSANGWIWSVAVWGISSSQGSNDVPLNQYFQTSDPCHKCQIVFVHKTIQFNVLTLAYLDVPCMVSRTWNAECTMRLAWIVATECDFRVYKHGRSGLRQKGTVSSISSIVCLSRSVQLPSGRTQCVLRDNLSSAETIERVAHNGSQQCL